MKYPTTLQKKIFSRLKKYYLIQTPDKTGYIGSLENSKKIMQYIDLIDSAVK